MKIKVCGMTNQEDARMAVALGVDALGFIFARSPRRVEPEDARRIIGTLPVFVKTVGVFVNENPDRMRQVMDFCGIDLAQLHGDETPDVCEAMMPRVLKAIRVKNTLRPSDVQAFRGRVRGVVLDTHSERLWGGTGRPFDWGLVHGISGMGIPIVLSGGLGPDNISKAIGIARPHAVDINSGVEEHPGKKSPLLMKRVMEKIRRTSPDGVATG